MQASKKNKDRPALSQKIRRMIWFYYLFGKAHFEPRAHQENGKPSSQKNDTDHGEDDNGDERHSISHSV
jgi:hypothetical protein